MSDTPSPPRFVLPILIAAGALSSVSVTMFLPAIPDIARDFDEPASRAQLLITAYLLVFAFCTLLVGPLSDRYGRRRVLVISTGIGSLASLACALAPTLDVLMAARALQALGSCAGVILPRAMIRDLFGPDRTARAMSAQASTIVLFPMLAPIAGGYIDVWLGWRAIFVLMAIAGVAVIALILRTLPETNLNLRNTMGLVRGMVTGLAELIVLRRFVGYSLVIAGNAVAFNSVNTSASLILIDSFGVTPDAFGLYFALMPLGFFFGSFTSNRVHALIAPDRLMTVGVVAHWLAGVAMVALSGYHAPLAVLGPAFWMGYCQGLMGPNAFSGSVSVQPRLAGSASGLTVFIQNTISSAATVVIAAAPHADAAPLGLMLTAGAALASVGCALALVRAR